MQARGSLWILATWFVLTSFSVTAADLAVLTTHDGRTLRGPLIREDARSVVLEISGFPYEIKREEIESLITNIALEYRLRRNNLDNEDLNGRLALANFLFQNQTLDLALRELIDLRLRFPYENKVEVLLVAVEQKLEQEQAAPVIRPGSASAGIRKRSTGSPDSDQNRRPAFLSAQQINLIRLWELPGDLMEAKPSIGVPRSTVDKLFDRYGSEELVPKGRKEQQRFRAAPGYEQLDLIFQLQARDLYGEVQVRTDPAPLREFRMINRLYVGPFFRRHFGTGKVGGLLLYYRKLDAVEEAYTNFFLLDRFELEGALMIDRARPIRSLLLQWGLPRESAVHPAPDIEGWRPFFSGLEDPTLIQYKNWIESLYQPKPDYGIVFEWPRPEADQLRTQNGSSSPIPEL